MTEQQKQEQNDTAAEADADEEEYEDEDDDGICPVCKKPVFMMERFGFNGKSYHMKCMKCTRCGKRLNLSQAYDHVRQPYCAKCFNLSFNPTTACFRGIYR